MQKGEKVLEPRELYVRVSGVIKNAEAKRAELEDRLDKIKQFQGAGDTEEANALMAKGIIEEIPNIISNQAIAGYQYARIMRLQPERDYDPSPYSAESSLPEKLKGVGEKVFSFCKEAGLNVQVSGRFTAGNFESFYIAISL